MRQADFAIREGREKAARMWRLFCGEKKK